MSAPMADVELLPCPFCGAGTTEIRENGRPWLGTRYGEPSSVSVRHWCEPIEGQPSRMIERVGRDRAAAIAAWNMRTTAPDWQAPAADGDARRHYAGVTVWIGDIKCTNIVSKEALELSNIDELSRSFEVARQYIDAAMQSESGRRG